MKLLLINVTLGLLISFQALSLSHRDDISKSLLKNYQIRHAVDLNVISQHSFAIDSTDMFFKGQMDASTYYNPSGPSIGTGIVSLLFWPAGLVVAIIVSSTPPNPTNWTTPKAKLLNNEDYFAGYKKGAKRKKSGKTWTGFGVGTLVGILLGALILSAS